MYVERRNVFHSERYGLKLTNFSILRYSLDKATTRAGRVVVDPEDV